MQNSKSEVVRVRSDPHRPNGAIIRAIRQARRLRLEELAARIPVTTGYLSRIELGTRAGTAKADRIAAALDVPAEVLTGRRPVIAILRGALDITPADLAHSAGITTDRLARIEQGSELPSSDLIAVLANRLGVDPAALRPHVHGHRLRPAS